MANSGIIKSEGMPGGRPGTPLSMWFEWEVTNINAEAGTGTLNWKIYGSSSQTTKYQIFGTDRNYCTLDGVEIFNASPLGSGSRTSPIKMYARRDQNRTTPYLVPSDQGWADSLVGKYTLWLGVLAEGSKTIYYDDEGYASFTVYGVFQCYHGTGSNYKKYLNKDREVTYVDRIDRYSRAKKTTDGGSNWSDSTGNYAFAWKTTDGGSTWTKCNLYKTTDGGSTWTKIT